MVLLLVAVVLPATGFLLLRNASPPKANTPEALFAMTVRCIPNGIPAGRVTREQEECARKVVLEYAAFRGAADINAALRLPYERSPGFADVCHGIAHDVGKALARREQDPVGTLRQVSSLICITGLLHGFMETLAADGADEATISSLIDACSTLDGGQEQSGCADGLGHMLWIRHGDFTTAARQCEEFEQAWMNMQCSYGVVMLAATIPAGAPVGTPSPVSPASMVDICEAWPVPEARGQYGCGSGLGFILTAPARGAYLELLDFGGRIGDGSEKALAAEKIFRESVGNCIALRSVAARLGCLADTARNVMSTHEVAFGGFEDFCQFIPEPYKVACPGEGRNLWSLYSEEAHIAVERELQGQPV